MRVICTLVGCGTKRMNTLLPQDSRVKVGSVLTLEKEEGQWTVLRQYGPPVDSSEINRGWKVGGILPHVHY